MSAYPVSSTPFFGRAYSLTITKADGSGSITVSDSAWEPEALRFTFEIEQYALQTYWFAVITIYNCDGPITSGPSKGQNLMGTVIGEGDIVTVKAGYQYGNYDTIWIGEIFQPTWEAEDVVDFKLTLHCILGRLLGTQNFINANIAANATQRQQWEIISNQATRSFPPTPSAQLDLLSTTQLSRGKNMMGLPLPMLYAIAKNNKLVAWMDTNGVNLANPGKPGPIEASYGPLYHLPSYAGTVPQVTANGVTLSLIGQPKQTLYGVNFCVLMDPRMKVKSPLPQVQINSNPFSVATIAPQLNSEGQGQPVRPLAKNGMYIVNGVRHVGDTRGRDWHTYVTGIDSVTDLMAWLGKN